MWGYVVGWTGDATLVVAAITLLAIVWQEIRHYRMRRDASWSARHYVTLGPRRLRITNTGDVAARGVLIRPHGFTGKKGQSGWEFPMIEAGQEEHLDIEGDTPESWIQFTWRSPNHRNRYVTTWLPVQTQSPLVEELHRQQMWSLAQSLKARIRYGIEAGPGAQLTAFLPRSPRKLSKVLARVQKKVAKRSAKQQRREQAAQDNYASLGE